MSFPKTLVLSLSDEIEKHLKTEQKGRERERRIQQK